MRCAEMDTSCRMSAAAPPAPPPDDDLVLELQLEEQRDAAAHVLRGYVALSKKGSNQHWQCSPCTQASRACKHSGSRFPRVFCNHVLNAPAGEHADSLVTAAKAYVRADQALSARTSHAAVKKVKRRRAVRDTVKQRAFARVGLAGNPSDGYGGKTLSFTIANYYADVTLLPRSDGAVHFIPNPAGDLDTFDDGLSGLVARVSRFGYEGAIALLAATCKQFAEATKDRVALCEGFDVAYETNIPRQRGLAGSSALCTAMFRALMALYRVDVAPEEVARRVWLAEKAELQLRAGLQDRVAQAFGGLVAMDFDPGQFAEGRGLFRRIDASALSDAHFLLVTHRDSSPKSSSGVFSDVSARFQRGEEAVVKGMRDIAALAVEAEAAVVARQWPRLAQVMNRNFDLRCALFGDAVSRLDRDVVELARAEGAGAKLPGSGGCVLVLAPTDDALHRVQARMHAAGHAVDKVFVADVAAA